MKTEGNIQTSENKTANEDSIPNKLENNKSRSYLSVVVESSKENLNKNTSNEIVLRYQRSKSLDPTINMNFESTDLRRLSVLSALSGDLNGIAIISTEDRKNDNSGVWYSFHSLQ